MKSSEINTPQKMLLKSTHRGLLNKLAVGAVSTLCLVTSTAAFAEPATVVSVNGYDGIWGATSATVTYAPKSGGANVSCAIPNSADRAAVSAVGGTMALIAKLYPTQFTSVDVNCAGGVFEISLFKGTAQSYLYADSSFSTEYSNINGVNCFTLGASLGDKVALAMATNLPMTSTCTNVPWAHENIKDVIF